MISARSVYTLLKELGYPSAEKVRVDVGNPFLMRVRLAGNPRLDIPYGQMREALVAYRQLLLADPGPLDQTKVVDFSALSSNDQLRTYARMTLRAK